MSKKFALHAPKEGVKMTEDTVDINVCKKCNRMFMFGYSTSSDYLNKSVEKCPECGFVGPERKFADGTKYRESWSMRLKVIGEVY